jgi:hypothetical protein
MSALGQKRRFASRPVTSDLPQSTDIIRPARLVRLVPLAEIAAPFRGLQVGIIWRRRREPFLPDSLCIWPRELLRCSGRCRQLAAI